MISRAYRFISSLIAVIFAARQYDSM